MVELLARRMTTIQVTLSLFTATIRWEHLMKSGWKMEALLDQVNNLTVGQLILS